jgi:hypothetical protein
MGKRNLVTIAAPVGRENSVVDQTGKTFLQDHVEELIAEDFLTVPTATLRVLYEFLVLAHERR